MLVKVNTHLWYGYWTRSESSCRANRKKNDPTYSTSKFVTRVFKIRAGFDIGFLPTSYKECDDILRKISDDTISVGNSSGVNLIAFSGGVDSSLTAYLVKNCLSHAEVHACIGVSPSLPQYQLETARDVAKSIGISLIEVETNEGNIPDYLSNQGSSCYHCKTTLYSTLSSISQFAGEKFHSKARPVIFNGTNADDLKDPTRLGLLAAMEHSVASPLASLSKSTVRAIARHVGLPNWNLAAAPCLRSRLDFGVPASKENLLAVEIAEDIVRVTAEIAPTENLRVRVLANQVAVIEVDERKLERVKDLVDFLKMRFASLGLNLLSVRMFKSGSLSRNLK